ncbi:hypothetical protein Tsubulata_036453 [Turnera subulata]|uniref:Voltage-gated hydrogen channel 1 n=1 Tax=Turnera subulata TaxID=218843 RepID=A0A9Q0FIE7_9ROSI|nr:hypothetical protein Tsubulata_036453 [Turnera subulata]
MNTPPKSITTQHPRPPINTTSISIQTVESSVQGLVKSWYRREKWKLFFHSRSEIDDLAIKRAAWRTHLSKILESTPARVIALLLLLLDLILTVFELSSSMISCTRKERSLGAAWYHWAGIAVLALLSAKSIALAVGLGGSFFRRPGYMVDGAVVTAALFLEAFLEGKGGGLLVIVSLWRVVRVVESAFELSDEAIEAQIEGTVLQFEALREENAKLMETIAEKDEIIEKLQEIIEKITCNH